MYGLPSSTWWQDKEKHFQVGNLYSHFVLTPIYSQDSCTKRFFSLTLRYLPLITIGLGVASRDGEPVFRSLIEADQPAFKIEENYFKAPVKKKDIFVPPEGFPDLVARYTVREMSLCWNFYGGNDFETATSGFSSGRRPGRSLDPRRRNDLEGWRAAGGKERDHNQLVSLCLNKMRFQHEQYPGAG